MKREQRIIRVGGSDRILKRDIQIDGKIGYDGWLFHKK